VSKEPCAVHDPPAPAVEGLVTFTDPPPLTISAPPPSKTLPAGHVAVEVPPMAESAPTTI